jgi:hypothetical protein
MQPGNTLEHYSGILLLPKSAAAFESSSSIPPFNAGFMTSK